MHRLRSQLSVVRFKTASWILLLKWTLIPSSLVLLAYSLVTSNFELSHIALGLILLSLCIACLQWLVAPQARCPLCLTPPVAHRKCSKHKTAKRLFGSYRLRVACAIILKGRFRCPYCGESTAIKVHQNRRKSAAWWSRSGAR